MSKKPVALIILDGFGYTPAEKGNAVKFAKTPNIDKYMEMYPHNLIKCSGMDVGLPDGQMGNSEVGHTNIGAGRVVYQELTRITKAIQDGDFFENETLLKAVENCKKNDSALHIMGLMSDGGVHVIIHICMDCWNWLKETALIKFMFTVSWTDVMFHLHQVQTMSRHWKMKWQKSG